MIPWLHLLFIPAILFVGIQIGIRIGLRLAARVEPGHTPHEPVSGTLAHAGTGGA